MNSLLEENLVAAFHLDLLTETKRREALEHIGRIVYERILLRVLAELTEEQKDAFDQLLAKKSKDSDAIFEFLNSTLPNLEQLVNEEIVKFKQSAAGIAAAANP